MNLCCTIVGSRKNCPAYSFKVRYPLSLKLWIHAIADKVAESAAIGRTLDKHRQSVVNNAARLLASHANTGFNPDAVHKSPEIHIPDSQNALDKISNPTPASASSQEISGNLDKAKTR